MQDFRFSRLLKDPRFVRPKKRQSKVPIDDRFKDMFTEESFTGKSTCKVDKFGRRINDKENTQISRDAVNSLRRFYKLEEDAESDAGILENNKQNRTNVDLARGEGIFFSSDSSSGDEQDDSFAHNPAAIDRDAITMGDATSRLAFVNLDWDNIQAQDIYQLVYSFKPPLGQVLSVKIYYSSYGKERISQESLHGPPSAIFRPLTSNEDKENRSQKDLKCENGDIASTSEDEILVEQEDTDVFYSGSEIEDLLHEEPSDLEVDTFDNVDNFSSSNRNANTDGVFAKMDSGKHKITANLDFEVNQQDNLPDIELNDQPIAHSYDQRDRFVTAKTSDDFDEEALRKYQLERLRYCFAIVETDSIETAEAIYTNCDGQEFEKTSNIIDIRYVPNEQEFDNEDIIPKGGVSTGLVDKYAPLDFSTLSLMHSKVSLTWDSDDIRRSKLTKARFSQDMLEEMDFRAYLASSDDEEGSQSEDDEKKEKSMEELLSVYKKLANNSNATNPYHTKSAKNLFEDEEPKLEEAKSDIDMEMTFLAESPPEDTEGITKQETVFQSKLRKEKERKERKRAERKGLHADHVAANKEDKSLSLMLDHKGASDDENAHFNMEKIVKREIKLLKKRHKKDLLLPKDSFEIQSEDSRFAAIYSAHDYSIDPSHPSFKNTSSMRKLLASKREKQSKMNGK